MNLLKETEKKLEKFNKSINDIDFVNLVKIDANMLSNPEYYSSDWDEFKDYAEKYFKDYDNGYGGQEVPNSF